MKIEHVWWKSGDLPFEMVVRGKLHMAISPDKTAALLITCPDKKGLVARISQFLLKHGGNILHADQHTDIISGFFLMRVEWDLTSWDLNQEDFQSAFHPIAFEFDMRWRIAYSENKKKVGILVSHLDHCLADLLYRNRIREFNCEIAVVISNHATAKDLVDFYKIPFYIIPIKNNDRDEAERLQLKLLNKFDIDLIILARYMQILSAEFVDRFPDRIINIHHSFLPAFVGAKPYHQAHEKGVKVIGATSHYVTPHLDGGPIIQQDVIRISHRDQVPDLVRKGRDLERVVLSQAVKWHLEDRIITYGNKTVVFD